MQRYTVYKGLISKFKILKFLEIRKEKVYYFFEKITKKTKVLFFILFCFSWNLKILNTDDIGSFPAYRLLRKTALYLMSFL